MSNEQKPEGWERKVLEDLAFASIKEQRRSRRWGIFFKLLGFGYLFLLIGLMMSSDDVLKAKTGKHTALIDVQGVIANDAEASADYVVTGLRNAFEDKNTVGVILRINSPGGSPVQSGYINDEIKRLKAKYPDIPFYAVISDVGASGAYYVAAAADKIYADKASIIGSIGVRMDSFGFVDAMRTIGVERRLLTAGEHKALMDPFLPEEPIGKEHLQGMLDQIHQQFIDVVKAGRGDRLKDDPDLFTGLIWTGEEAMKLGLVDELGSASYVAREIIKEDNLVDFTKKQDVWKRLSDRLGAGFAKALMAGVRGDTFNLN
jgi:protease-4